MKKTLQVSIAILFTLIIFGSMQVNADSMYNLSNNGDDTVLAPIPTDNTEYYDENNTDAEDYEEYPEESKTQKIFNHVDNMLYNTNDILEKTNSILNKVNRFL